MIKLKYLFVIILFPFYLLGGEIIKFSPYDVKLKKNADIVAELHLPQGSGPFPLIITQHGSTRNQDFQNGNGKTDDYSIEIVKQGLEAGFAVATPDSFYHMDISPSDKINFPIAMSFGVELKDILSQHPKIDKKNIFYTGFSFGGTTSLISLTNETVQLSQYQLAQSNVPWKAVSPVEASCNFQFKPEKIDFKVLFVQGSESHYEPKPCIYYHDQLSNLNLDDQIKIIIIEDANHYFSTDGKITKGVAANGCKDNPVIITENEWMFADGEVTTRKDAFKSCLTDRAGNRGNLKKLPVAVKEVINFFIKNTD